MATPSAPAARTALVVALVLLGLAAAPAHATLLVRSDGEGLFVMDKNGLSDNVAIGAGPPGGGPTDYDIVNLNSFDIFKFDAQVGCTTVSNFASCFRNGPKISIQLAGGSDFLTMLGDGFEAPVGESSVAAGSGDDRVIGHAGKDHLFGQSGDDILKGGPGNDEVEGGDGSDRLEGENGNDSIEGGAGSDALIGGLGADVLRGGSGNDVITAREAFGTAAAEDSVDCGSGSDLLEGDLKDTKPIGCEQSNIAPVGETPNVEITAKTLRVSASGEVGVRLHCPREVESLGCKGRLDLRVQSSGPPKVRYEIRAGASKTVTLRLTSSGIRSLRDRLRRGRTTRGILTSVETGRKGLKTTIRDPKLALR